MTRADFEATYGINAVTRPFNVAEEYAAHRRRVGTQAEVAGLLGVDPMTISRRERGVRVINTEAWRALLSLQMPADGRRIALGA